jgi:hypothetical protein
MIYSFTGNHGTARAAQGWVRVRSFMPSPP